MIRSPNLSSMISRLTRAQAAIPEKIKEAVAPETWISDLRTIAFDTMHSVAVSTKEVDAIPVIMEAFSATSTGNGSEFSLIAFPWEVLAAAFDPTELKSNDALRQRIVDWVERFKIKDERDQDSSGETLSAARIASRVVEAIWSDPTPWLRTDEPGRGALNPEGLAMITGLTGLTPEKAARMITAVLAAWVAFVKLNLPAIAASKLREAFQT